MNILVSGATGFVGSALTAFLESDGHRVVRLSRDPSVGEATWDIQKGEIDLRETPPLDAVVHLAGENIMGRWTKDKKARIRNSRVQGTALLCKALTELSRKPKVLVAASAVGYYGDREAEIVDEDSGPGTGFFAETCQAWEKATEAAAGAGIRVVNLRFGLILSRQGGALGRMLPVFRLGLGGKLGSGRQYWSWITLPDVLRVVQHAFENETLSGPVNVVAPSPATNFEFTKALGKVLNRPTLCAVPTFGMRAVFGEMADEALLASVRVVPTRLMKDQFQFEQAELETALRELLA